MKKAFLYGLFALLLVFSTSLMSCNRNKVGCPVNQNVHTKTDRKGNLSTKRGKTSLFPKNMKKKKRKGK